jgi:hypothetical protein
MDDAVKLLRRESTIETGRTSGSKNCEIRRIVETGRGQINTMQHSPSRVGNIRSDRPQILRFLHSPKVQHRAQQ